MLALAFNAVVCMGGQGARRKRNWRHNRPNSPYNLARIAMLGDAGLCPAQREQLEKQRREAEAQRKAEQTQSGDGAGHNADC
jgi:hypothetical protein